MHSSVSAALLRSVLLGPAALALAVDRLLFLLSHLLVLRRPLLLFSLVLPLSRRSTRRGPPAQDADVALDA